MTCLSRVRQTFHALREKLHFRTLLTDSGVTCKDPLKIFGEWFFEARNLCDPRDMILTAVLSDDSFFLQPLQCQSYSERGFKYYLVEKPDARKNDNAALTFIWPSKRMVRIEGTTKPLPKQEIEQFFFNRIPYEEQITMVCFGDTAVVDGKKVLRDKVDMAKKKYGKGKVPMPTYFCGHLLAPLNIEFYENTGGTFQNRLMFIRNGQKQAADDRLVFTGENGWNYQILSP